MAVETGAAQVLADRRLRAEQTRGSGSACGTQRGGADDYRLLDTRVPPGHRGADGLADCWPRRADARMRVTDLLNAIPVLRRNIEHAAAQHAAIVDAILQGDPEATRRAVAEHLEGTAALLRGFLT